MPMYRKKPVVIEAYRYAVEDDIRFLLSWMGTSARPGARCESIQIKTLEGNIYAHPGDWIIKGVNGGFYPCKDDIFRKAYDEVEG